MRSQENNLYILFALILIVGISACNETDKENHKQSSNPSKELQIVEVTNAQKRSFTSEILITGTARPNQTVLIYSMESGVLRQLRKDIGDKVNFGETIAVLENPELQQQQKKFKAELKGKESVYNRLKSIYDKTPALTTHQSLENSEAEYLAAKANLDGINSRLAFLTIKAPFKGIITKRMVDKGSLLQNGLNEDNPQAIVEIQAVNPIRLRIEVPESDAVFIKKGMGVEVTFPELSGKNYDAKISRTSNSLDAISKTMQVEIDLDNNDGEIISGMYAKVLMLVSSRENILSLPLMSKTRYKNEDYVLIVEDQIVKRIPIMIGLSDKEYFEILNAEISNESQVILTGKGLVKAGQKVTPILKSE